MFITMRRYLRLLFSIPYSVWFCLRYLPLSVAIRLPVWIAPNLRIKSMHRGALLLANPRFNAVHIGFHEADAVDSYGVHTILCIRKGGKWIIESDAHIGHGAIIHVNDKGTLRVGSRFAISGTTSIVCSKQITIGDDVQFSWNTLVMDSDAHTIYGNDGDIINPPTDITIGNKVWIAADVTILKNSYIGNNCIVASKSLVNRRIKEDNQILAGSPAKAVKRIKGWSI